MGRYCIVDKGKNEMPKRLTADGKAFEEYSNQDGTPYVSKPFICTTYPSFGEADRDIAQKTVVFQDAWNDALNCLKAKYPQPSGCKVRNLGPKGISPAVASAIFRF